MSQPHAVVTLGDIQIDGPWIRTPVGALNRDVTYWEVGSWITIPSKVATWAIAVSVTMAVVGVLFAACTFGLSLLLLFGLFLLLVKEGGGGYIPVRVADGRLDFVTNVPVADISHHAQVMRVIAWARPRPGPTTMRALPYE
jgi:hypothetical protein